MSRFVLLYVFGFCAIADSAEYVVKVDAIETKTIDGKANPKGKLLHSVEVITELDKPFRVRIRNGRSIITTIGRVTLQQDGSHYIKISHRQDVLTSENKVELDWSVQTGVGIDVDKPVMLAGTQLSSTQSKPAKLFRRTKVKVVENSLFVYVTLGFGVPRKGNPEPFTPIRPQR